MNTLRKLLSHKGYRRSPLRFTVTNHIEVDAILNGVFGTFILDTGASNSCVDFEAEHKFNLFAEDSEVRAAGAGSGDMRTQLSQENLLQLGEWSRKKISLVLFDLSHVNKALVAHKGTPVDGIIGGDILKRGKAVIDYANWCLYLK